MAENVKVIFRPQTHMFEEALDYVMHILHVIYIGLHFGSKKTGKISIVFDDL